MKQIIAICVLFVILASSFPVAGQNTAGEFIITIDDTIDTPDRTVTVEEEEYLVSSVSRVLSGDSVNISTTAPEGTRYDIYLYNSDRQIITTRNVSGNASWIIDSSNYDPGSYVVAIRGPDGEYRSVQPVVFAAYSIDLTVPETAESSSSVEVGVELTRIAPASSEQSVEVVLTDGDILRQVEAVESGSGEYTAMLPVDVEAGEYRVYATVRGDEAYDSQAELLAISDSQPITVEILEEESDSDLDDVEDSPTEQSTTGAPSTTVTPRSFANETASDLSSEGGTPTEAAAAGSTPTGTVDNIVTPVTTESTPASSGSTRNWLTTGAVLLVLAMVNIIGLRIVLS